jgi:putative MATE family efflux protein
MAEILTTYKQTLRLFWPVFIEQLFAVTISFLATLMVRSVSESAVAGVGMVGILNILITNAFTAVSAGVSVVVSQCVGRGEATFAGKCGSQSIVLVLYISTGVGILMAVLARPILVILFGRSEPEVLSAAEIYMIHSCLSMPFLALFTTLSGIVRSTGNTKGPMVCSVVSNLVYALAAYVCIELLGLQVAGAGYAIDVSRIIPAVMMCFLMRKGKSGIFLAKITPKLNLTILKPILRIAIPSGIDSLVFNGGKLIVNIFLSGMGTPVLVASSIVNNVASLINVPGTAMQVISVTLTGQAYGKGEIQQTSKQMLRMTLLGMAALALTSIPCFFLAGPVVSLFSPSDPARIEALRSLRFVCIITPIFWSPSFITPQTLRSANRVLVTMWVSIGSMFLFRVTGAWLLGVVLEMHLMGVWISMFLDWIARSAVFIPLMLNFRQSETKRLTTQAVDLATKERS